MQNDEHIVFMFLYWYENWETKFQGDAYEPMLKSQGSIEGNLQQIPVNKVIGKKDVYKVRPTLNSLQKNVLGAESSVRILIFCTWLLFMKRGDLFLLPTLIGPTHWNKKKNLIMANSKGC